MLVEALGALVRQHLVDLAVALGLLGLAFWRFPRLLESSIPLLNKNPLKAMNLDLTVMRLAGRSYLARAGRAERRGDRTKASALFEQAIRLLEFVLDEGRQRAVDVSRIEPLMDAPSLASLYSQRAWAKRSSDPGGAVESANRALRVDLNDVEARMARGWAKLERRAGSDIAEAEADFRAAMDLGLQQGLQYFWAQYGLAETLRYRGDPAKSLDEYTALLPHDWRRDEIRTGRGLAYYDLGNWQKAVEEFDVALEVNPDHSTALEFRASALFMTGRLEEAIEDANEMIQREPENHQGYYTLGLALYQQSRALPPAVAERRALLEATRKQLRTAKDIADSRKLPISDIAHWLSAVAGDLDDKEEAKRMRNDARNSATGSGLPVHVPDILALWPSVRDVLQTRTRDDLDTLLGEAIDLTQRNPHDASAHYTAGVLYLVRAEDATDPARKAADLIEAGNYIERTIRLPPVWATPFYTSALMHLRSGDLARARQDCDRAIALDQTLGDAYWLRAKIRMAIDDRDRADDDVDAALACVIAAIERGDSSATRYAMRAGLYLDKGALPQAIEDAGKTIALDQQNLAAHLVLSQAFIKQGKFEAAILEAERAAKINPASTDAHMARGVGYQYRGDAQAAVDAYTAVIELQPVLPTPYYNRGLARIAIWERTKADADLEEADRDFIAASTKPGGASAGNGGRAWLRYRQHREGRPTLDEALSFCRLALEQHVTFGFGHFCRAWIMSAKGRYEDAKSGFSTAIKFGYDVPDSYYGLADAERVLGNRDAAIMRYGQAIENAAASGTNPWNYHHGRALAFAAARSWQQAYDDFRAAVERAQRASVAPSVFASLYSDFAWTCYELRRDDEMEEALTRSLELDSKSRNLHLQIGSLRLYSGRHDDAIAAFSTAIELDSASSLGYVDRGLTRIYQGDFDAAISDLDIALEKNDKDAYAWHDRGWARLRQATDRRQALADIDKAIGLSTRDPFRFIDRALLRWWLGDREHALEDLRQVMAMQSATSVNPFAPRLREDVVTWGATSQDWSRAVEAQPNDDFVYFGRGLARCMAGDLAGAADDLTRARKLNARSPETRALLKRVRAERAAA